MSNQKVEEFLTKVGEDLSLQTELSHALESDNDRQAVTDLAKSKGYEFSSDELWAEVQKRQAEFGTNDTNGELSEADLETVAGGISPTIAATITLAAGGGGVGIGIGVSQIKW
jgi:predicted ribosomally synthesized peptide with nif11-like leader